MAEHRHDKHQARLMAERAWETSSRLAGLEFAPCDDCGEPLEPRQGFLCNTSGVSLLIFGSAVPDLVCAECYEQWPREPWEGPIP